jgi:hypothetical protein
LDDARQTASGIAVQIDGSRGETFEQPNNVGTSELTGDHERDLREDLDRHQAGTVLGDEGGPGASVIRVLPVGEREDGRGVEGDHALSA